MWLGCEGAIRSERNEVCLGSGGGTGAHCGLHLSSCSFGGSGLAPAFQSVKCDPAGLRLGLCIRGALFLLWRGDGLNLLSRTTLRGGSQVPWR